jgi:hypothetical protein
VLTIRVFQVMTLTIAPPLIQQLQPRFLHLRDIYESREGSAKIYSWPAMVWGAILSEIPYRILSGTIYCESYHRRVCATTWLTDMQGAAGTGLQGSQGTLTPRQAYGSSLCYSKSTTLDLDRQSPPLLQTSFWLRCLCRYSLRSVSAPKIRLQHPGPTFGLENMIVQDRSIWIVLTGAQLSRSAVS